MEARREVSRRSSRARYLVAAVGVLGLVMTGCGGKSGSSTGSSSSTGQLKRLEVRVVRGGAAEAPRRSMLARVADLLGWPQLAEASSGIQGCSVSAVAPASPVVLTDVDGNAVLTGVSFPNTIHVACPGAQSGDFPVTGAAGAVVKVEVEVGSIEVKVKSQHVSQPNVSQPSQPSQPSKPKPVS